MKKAVIDRTTFFLSINTMNRITGSYISTSLSKNHQSVDGFWTVKSKFKFYQF